MRDVFAFCTLLGSLIVFVASLAALVKPIPQIRLSNRKRASAGIGIAFFLFMITAIIIPSPATDQSTSNVKLNPPAIKAVTVSKSLTKAQENVVSFVRNAVMQTISCKGDMDMTQRAIDKLADGTGRPIDVYEEAKRGIKSCGDASLEFAREDLFDLIPSGDRKAAKNALGKCNQVALGRKSAMALAQKLLESDGKLAEVSKYLELKRTADTDEIFCRDQLAGLADRSKIPDRVMEFAKP